MSIHLILCAREVTGLPASSKLLLLCMAENARDDRLRIASPGQEQMALWSMLKHSQMYDALKPLYEVRVLRQHRRGQKGVRAEYVVFPDGCCDRHGPISAPGSADAESACSGSGAADRTRPSASATPDSTGACGYSGQPDAEPGSASGRDDFSVRSTPHQHPLDRTPPVTPSPQPLSPGLTTSTTSAETQPGNDEDRDVVGMLQRLATA